MYITFVLIYRIQGADSSVASPVSILSVWIVKDNPNQSSCIVIVVFSNHDMSNKAAKRSPAQHNSTQLFCSYTLIRLFLHTSCAAHPVAGGAHWHKQLEGKEQRISTMRDLGVHDLPPIHLKQGGRGQDIY